MKLKLLIFFLTASFYAAAFQDQPLREIGRTLSEYHKNVQPLKVHLTFNQPSYVAGDTMFFHAAVVKAADHKPIDNNSIMHVMLMNQEGRALTNQKVRLQNGLASNQVVLPPSLESGLYVLVAYHEWMKGLDPKFFFQQHILIHGNKPYALAPSKGFSVFPEGGHIVAAVENKIVVKGTPNTNVVVTNSGGEQQASFTTDKYGFASFFLKPAASVSYSATAQGQTYNFPEVETGGAALVVNRADDGSQIQVAVAGEPQLQRVRVVIDANGEVFYNSLLKLESGRGAVTIPTIEMPAGVGRVTLFNDRSAVLAERLVFISSPSSVKSAIVVDEKNISTRKKVTAKVKVSASEDLAGTTLAASIYNKTLFAEANQVGIVADLMLYSNISGSLTNNTFGFSPDSPQWRDVVDLLLITQKQARISWKDVLENAKPLERQTNIRFSGQIVNDKTGQIMTDTTFVTLFLQKNVVTYQTFTNKGKFDMPLYIDFFGQDEVFYQIEKRGKVVPDARIRIVEEPELKVEWPTLIEANASNPVFVNARQQKLITNSFGYYQQKTNYKKVTSPNAHIEEEIDGADQVIDLEKFLLFPTMEETIREIIPMVQHRKIKNVSTIRVYFSDINRQATVSPVFIIDGIMTDDVDYFMRLKPTDVSKIKVVNTREKVKTFGSIGRGGVILVETKIPDSFNKIPRSRNSFVVHGLSEQVKPFTFDGASYKDRIPDLRTSLYWNPQLTLDDNGEAEISFYTSDVTGDYAIIAEGLTPSGQPISIETSFSVEFKGGSN